MEWSLAFIALTLLLVAAISTRLSDTAVTATIVFVACGLLLGPLVFDEIDFPTAGSAVRTLAEATLTLVLFADAAQVNVRKLRDDPVLPTRLLGIGLPLTIAAGTLVAGWVLGTLTFTEALVLAVVLAPTDAALSHAVVTADRVPARIRRALNVEGGLNDGICVPLLLIALAAATAESHGSGAAAAFKIVAEQIGYGVLSGLAAGAIAAGVIVVAGRRGLIAPGWRQVVTVAGALLGYGVATPLGGSGFIGAFVAGAVFGLLGKEDARELTLLDNELATLLNGVTFVVFGAVLLGPAIQQLTWSEVGYALLSLTVVRIVPVALALIGTGAAWQTVAFVGWFGPRGLASIVFAVIVIEESHLPHVPTILVTTYITIGFSVVLHGVSGAPLANRYARWSEGRKDAPGLPADGG